MTPKALLSAVVASAVLLGCAYPWPRVASDRTCVAKDCWVKVSVRSGVTGPCYLEVDTGKVIVDPEKKFPEAGKVLFWEFAPGNAGAEFTDDGVWFKDARSGMQCTKQGDRQFKCNNPRNAGQWEYGIKARSGGALCEPLDPSIVNP